MGISWMLFIGSAGITAMYWIFGFKYVKKITKKGDE